MGRFPWPLGQSSPFIAVSPSTEPSARTPAPPLRSWSSAFSANTATRLTFKKRRPKPCWPKRSCSARIGWVRDSRTPELGDEGVPSSR